MTASQGSTRLKLEPVFPEAKKEMIVSHPAGDNDDTLSQLFLMPVLSASLGVVAKSALFLYGSERKVCDSQVLEHEPSSGQQQTPESCTVNRLSKECSSPTDLLPEA